MKRFIHIQMIGRVLLVLSLIVAVAAADSISYHGVNDWSVRDVVHWVNYTIGYPEYATYFERNLVDGPTLLRMSVDDIDNSMPIANSIHSSKFDAHLRMMQGMCLCAEDEVGANFWSYLGKNPRAVWVYVPAAVYCPRVALVAAYLWDADIYQYLSLGSSDSPLLGSIAYWVLGALFPSAFLFLHWIALVTTNPFLVIPTALTFLIAEMVEVQTVFSIKEILKCPAKDIIFTFFPLPTFAPILTYILSLFMPNLILQGAVWLFVGFNVFCIAGWVMSLREARTSGSEEDEKPKTD